MMQPVLQTLTSTIVFIAFVNLIVCGGEYSIWKGDLLA